LPCDPQARKAKTGEVDRCRVGAGARPTVQCRLQVVVQNTLGALGRIATEISSSGTNILNVHMDEKDSGLYTTLHFTVQVADRTSLARLMRSLRRIPEVVRIAREQGLPAA
jgi:guanosine-3',5'-bis(diphosphate) 3'-pyrophosphohydrolase